MFKRLIRHTSAFTIAFIFCLLCWQYCIQTFFPKIINPDFRGISYDLPFLLKFKLTTIIKESFLGIGMELRFDKHLGWVNIPNISFLEDGKRYTFNSFGFRSGEVNPSKKHILLVGDSVALGGFVGDEETMAYYLDKRLTEYQVLNLAVPGYGLPQYYLNLKNNIDQLNTKLAIVIIGTGQDVFETARGTFNMSVKPFFKVDQKKVKWSELENTKLDSSNLILINNHVKRSSCHKLLNLISHLSFFKLAYTKKKTNQVKAYFCPELGVHPKELHYVIKGILLLLKELAKKKRIDLFFVLSPDMFEIKENKKIKKEMELPLIFKDLPTGIIPKNWKRKPEALMWRSFMKQMELEYLDFYNQMIQKGLKSEELFFDNFHYSPLGNFYLANAIYDRIKDRL